MSNQLQWEESWDEKGRMEWEALSGYHDEGSPFRFRITKFKTHYRETSDADIIDSPPRRWASLGEAQAALQADYDAMIAED